MAVDGEASTSRTTGKWLCAPALQANVSAFLTLRNSTLCFHVFNNTDGASHPDTPSQLPTDAGSTGSCGVLYRAEQGSSSGDSEAPGPGGRWWLL